VVLEPVAVALVLALEQGPVLVPGLALPVELELAAVAVAVAAAVAVVLLVGWVLAQAHFRGLAAAVFPARQSGAICLDRCQLSGAGQAGSQRSPGR
jgi:hypothetical protein